MSSPKHCIFFGTIILALITTNFSAIAGLYGFHHYNPYTKEEEILDLKEVPLNLHNYRADMRENLLMLIRYAKEKNPNFKIIVHEGQELLSKSLWEYDREGYNRARRHENAEDNSFLFHTNYNDQLPKHHTPAYDYLHSIDAVAINNLYCGKGHETKTTKLSNLGKITIEHCASQNEKEDAVIRANLNNKISYAFTDLSIAFSTIGDHNELNDSSKNIYNVTDAQNILILINDSFYTNKEDLVNDLLKTNYDIIIMNPLFANHKRFSSEDLQKLHFKKNGSKRLLIAKFNVSETSSDDYFWQKDWQIGSPKWLIRKSFSSPETIITQYWNIEWKRIISRYFKDIVNEGFDGVFLTGIENYSYFEQQNPLE